MRRDMEYCRKLLLNFSAGVYEKVIPKYDQFSLSSPYSEEDQINGEKYILHIKLLKDGGFINATISENISEYYVMHSCPSLTWDGNDYLDKIENDTVWEKTKDTLKEKGLEIAKVPLNIISEIATKEFKRFLGVD